MTGMTLSEFTEKVSFGAEIEFEYHGITYFLQGYADGDEHVLTLERWTDASNGLQDYLLKIREKTQVECADAFFEAAVFEGKTLYEAEQDIRVLYG